MPHLRIQSRLFALAGLAFALCAHAGFNHWTFSGPAAGGGDVSVVTAHPTDANIALAGTPRGIFRTSNKGLLWTMVKDDLVGLATAIVFDPSNPNRVVVADGSLHLSSNAGQSFTTLAIPATTCLLYTSPSPRDQRGSRMPSSA